MFPFALTTDGSTGTYGFFNVRFGSGPVAKAEAVDVKFSIHLLKKCFIGKYHLIFNVRVGS